MLRNSFVFLDLKIDGSCVCVCRQWNSWKWEQSQSYVTLRHRRIGGGGENNEMNSKQNTILFREP
jgi:hypothetical protein